MVVSVDIWRGSTGDGFKDKLTEAMTQAVQGYKCYCKDYLPVGWLRDHVIKSRQYTQYFWQHLAHYLEHKIIMLTLFNLLEKSICLLMSHQVVQICKDLHEFRHNANDVGLWDQHGYVLCMGDAPSPWLYGGLPEGQVLEAPSNQHHIHAFSHTHDGRPVSCWI